MSRVASISRGVGALAAALFFGAPIAIQIGLLRPGVGFYLFMLGGLLGLIALILGGIGLLRTREGSGREGRSRALTGAGLGALILAIVFATAGPTAGLPPINDITTSPDDPPQFVDALEHGPNAGRDMSYPPDFAAQQKAGYPDLAPIEVAAPPEEVLDRISGLVKDFGWELVARHDPSGRIEANETSTIFRFVDDVVVRVRAKGSGSLVDVRSKSRDGRGDLGANAARIRRIRDGLGS